MSSITRDDVRMFVTNFLNQKLKEQRRDLLRDLGDEYDIFSSGIIDSLGFVELITAAGEHFGGELDLDGLDPEEMTLVGALCAFMAAEFNLHADPSS